MINEVLLENRKSVDENLRPLKVGDSCTSLELANRNARIHGDLEVTGVLSVSKLTDLNIDDIVLDDIECDTITGAGGHILTFRSNDCTLTSGADFKIDIDEDFVLDCNRVSITPAAWVNIDKNHSDTDADPNIKAVAIDFDKTGASASNNTMYGLSLDMDNTSATTGNNTMYGLHCTPTLTHANDGGTPIVIGAYISALSSSNGTSTSKGLVINQAAAGTADTNLGLVIESAADTGDYFSISTTTAGATTMTTVDDDGADAHLTIVADGIIQLSPTTTYGVYITPVTKTASGTADSSLTLFENLDLDTGAGGTDAHFGIRYVQVQTDLTGWDNVYLMHLSGGVGKALSIDSNANMKLNDDRKIKFGDSGGEYIVGDGTNLDIVSSGDISLDAAGDIDFDAGGSDITFSTAGTAYLAWSALGALTMKAVADTNDLFQISIANTGITTLATNDDSDGNLADLILNIEGDIQLNSGNGNFIYQYAFTEFSAANSAYAGIILGYTRLQGDLTNQGSFELQNDITVEDDTHQITFKTPPSELVEIEATFAINRTSTDARVYAGLSDQSASEGYNSLGVEYEYDASIGVAFSDDEADDGIYVVKWVVVASDLEAIGSSNTLYIGFSTAGATKSVYLNYGVRASHSICDPPFIIKATALPASIYDGL